ncbi:MAG: hypothetical protein QOE76_3972 [Frankiales bacterium]|jgi:hypothetical protein|nr:hypothetical protein [Frankiales bacterium]
MTDENHLLDRMGLEGPIDRQRDDVIIPSGRGGAAQRELYGALMKGFGDHEQDQLEHLMIDNIARLRDDGDSYAP